MKELDLNTWSRREQFDFFQQAEDPFVGVVVELDVTKGYERCKQKGWSFHHYYHFLTIKLVNEIEEFRYRTVGGKPVVLDLIHVGTTLLREDKTFVFAYVDYSPEMTFEEFSQLATKNFDEALQGEGMQASERSRDLDIIHYTTVPWLNFKGLRLPKGFNKEDSVPKISFGKMVKQGEKKTMPIAIDVHHGLVDGYHLGQFVERLEELLDQGV